MHYKISIFNIFFRDLVHRQTACAAIKHMALGVYGFGCEDALIHLLNHVWPNIFETSPHLSLIHICLRWAGHVARMGEERLSLIHI